MVRYGRRRNNMNTFSKREKRSDGNPIANHIVATISTTYARHVEPRSKAEDAHRRELMLNVILLGSIALLSALDITILYEWITKGHLYAGIPFGEFSILVAIFIGLYAMSRMGRIKTASYALIALYFIGTGISTYLWGASLPANLLGYALCITISSVLVSSRFGFVSAITTFVLLISLGWSEISSGMIPEWKQNAATMNDVISYAIILLAIAFISWLSNRETEYSLKRARRSEAELTLEKASLETKVVERTQELRRAQVEGISQLSRFAEFGRLSSGLFHDLVSPLSAIILNLQDIGGATHPDLDDIQDKLKKSVRASRRMDAFILCIKRQMRSGEFEELFSANEMIEDAIGLFHYKALRAHVDLSFRAEHSLPMFGNPLRFHQIVANLISNGIDSYEFAPLLRHGRAIDKRVRVSLERDKGMTIATVRDYGAGMSPDTLSKIFEPFFTTKSRDIAMGIGLSTTKEIIERDFGGTIEVKSSLGKGTIFTVKLPTRRHAKTTKPSGAYPTSTTL
jgi:signal transduction histidine kinase